LNIKPCMGQISGTCEYWRKNLDQFSEVSQIFPHFALKSREREKSSRPVFTMCGEPWFGLKIWHGGIIKWVHKFLWLALNYKFGSFVKMSLQISLCFNNCQCLTRHCCIFLIHGLYLVESTKGISFVCFLLFLFKNSALLLDHVSERYNSV
jgi:hypothetical protein